MPKQTDKYKLGYFEAGDSVTAASEIDRTRFLTLDRQILGLFEVLGNGIISGWELVSNDDTAYEITVNPGSGHVDYVAVDSDEAATVTILPDTVNYIYAGIEIDSYYSGYVRFIAYATPPEDETLLLLGSVTTNPSTSSTTIDSISEDGRVALSFQQALLDIVKEHRHLGGEDDPTKINLQTDVQGLLRPENMANLDASLILRGVIDKARLPKIDHIEDLVNQGILTHAQLDTFVQLLDNVGARLMGEISATNLLKLILALKHVYPTIDEFMINEIAYIPGISPDQHVDQVNTTADVDYRTSGEGGTHTITGTPADANQTYTKKWDEEAEFDEATRSGSVVFGDSIMLATLENSVYVDDFENVSDWNTTVESASDVVANFYYDPTKESAKLDVGSEDAETVLLLSKTFEPQDWSEYDRLVFRIYTDSTEHGDVYFYISDSEAGSQGSYRIVLEKNRPTIDPATSEVGWREISVDLTELQREHVNFVGFYVSTNSGWNTAAPFTLNVDDMTVTSGNIFRPSGNSIFRFGNGFPHLFSYLRWDASEPTGVTLRARTRVANTEGDLEYAAWSSYLTLSGSAIELPLAATQYKYIDIDVLLEADSTARKSPQLKSLMLDSTATADDMSFDFDSSDSWKSGGLNNMDADLVEGSITLKYAGDIGTYILGTDGGVKQLSSTGADKLDVSGVSAPLSFVQMISGGSGFGKVTAVDYSVDGNFLITDPENDRVMEIDRAGNVVWGLMGAYPEEPVNPWADTEENAAAAEESAATADTEEVQDRTLEMAGCYYDPATSKLTIMFNENTANLYTSSNIDLSKFILKSGTRRVYLGYDNADIEMFGIDREHASVEVADKHFSASNVLLIELAQADAVALNNVAESDEPTLVISSPFVNELSVLSDVGSAFVVTNSIFGTECGIRLTVDSGTPIDIYDLPSYDMTSLADGTHVLEAVLIDMSGNEFTGSTASSAVDFLVETGVHSEVQVEITSPASNATVSADTLSISYAVYNLPAGGKIKYAIDGGTEQEHTAASPIEISGLDAGIRSVEVFLTDSGDTPLTGDFVSATISVIMSNRGSVPFTMEISEDAVFSESGVGSKSGSVTVDITPVKVANVHAPIDVRSVSSDKSIGDAGQFTVLVAKVASPSYPNYYSQEAIFEDGFSVVEFALDGSVASSCNDAIIARSRGEALSILGSVEKGPGNSILIGDASGNRAIVSTIDTESQTTSVVWEYSSDRIISDFSRVPNTIFEVTVSDSGLSSSESFIQRDSSMTWINNTTENIRVLSGSTTPNQFAADPDLSIYGDDFDSGIIAPGEMYSHRMIDYGTFDYFVWPAISTGKIQVTNSPVSPHDKFTLVENDVTSSSFDNRVAMIDAWGNVEWTFGESILGRIKDARPLSGIEVVVTV